MQKPLPDRALWPADLDLYCILQTVLHTPKRPFLMRKHKHTLTHTHRERERERERERDLSKNVIY